MAIKNWTTWNNDYDYMYTDNKITESRIVIKHTGGIFLWNGKKEKRGNPEYTVSILIGKGEDLGFRGIAAKKTISKKFKTKQNALAYAKAYMRTH